jgi:hypothetical protein
MLPARPRGMPKNFSITTICTHPLNIKMLRAVVVRQSFFISTAARAWITDIFVPNPFDEFLWCDFEEFG